MKPSVVRPGMKKPGSGKKELLPKKIGVTSKKEVLPGKLTGKAAIKEFQKQISPKGMAKTKAEQTAALDALMKKRYPGKQMGKVVKKIVADSKKKAAVESQKIKDQVKKPKINRDPRYDLYNPR